MNKQPVSYLQTDPRWAKLPYRVTGESATIGGSGCGPACAAMVIETLTGKTCTPVETCRWSVDHGYKALNQGTYYSYFVPQLKAFGIDCWRLNSVSVYGKPGDICHDRVLELLKEGCYIIACMGKGLWTSSGHFVLVWWAGGKIYINDPASSRSERLRGDMTTFRGQVKYYWAVDAREHNKEEIDVTEQRLREIVREEIQKLEAERADLPASPWAEKLLAQAAAKGITDGTRPQAAATRQEVAIMVNAVT